MPANGNSVRQLADIQLPAYPTFAISEYVPGYARIVPPWLFTLTQSANHVYHVIEGLSHFLTLTLVKAQL